MKVFFNKFKANLVLLFLAVFAREVRGCKLVEHTQDRCRSDGRIWLGEGINKNAYKGQVSTYTISPSMKELYWFCRHDKERVAWGGGANRLHVSFRYDGVIIWQFQKCGSTAPPRCQTRKPPQKTSDKCRRGGHLWLADGVEKSIPKGKADDSIEISRGMRELRWYCGYISQERVAWGGNANRLRVHFYSNGHITWEFFTCNPPAECSNNNHPSSVNIKLKKLTLKSSPTDNVAFGWESLFGKPADEIAVNLESKYCYTKSKTREIKKYQSLYYNYPAVSLNSFKDEPIKFWLTEEDSGFEGRNDLSQVVTISAAKMTAIRKYLKSNPSARMELDYSVTVKGQNIFQEHKWFGFLAENLCINVLDFVIGPWTGSLLSKNMAKLYNTIKIKYQAGTLTKTNFFKAVMTYQIRQGLKKSVKLNMKDAIKDWALDQTKLDNELRKTAEQALKELGAFNIYEKVIEFSSKLEELTGMLEFCLVEVLPPARDALYDVYFTVSK